MESLFQKLMLIVSSISNKNQGRTMQISETKFLKILQIYLVELGEKLKNKGSELHSL